MFVLKGLFVVLLGRTHTATRWRCRPSATSGVVLGHDGVSIKNPSHVPTYYVTLCLLLKEKQ